MTVLRILPPLVSVEITVWRLGGFTSILEQSTLSNERTPSPNVHTVESPSKSSDGPLSADRSLTPTDAHLNMQMMLTVMTYKLPRVHDQYLQNKASFLFVDCPSASAPSTDHDVLLSLTPILFHLVVQSFSVLESSTTAQLFPLHLVYDNTRQSHPWPATCVPVFLSLFSTSCIPWMLLPSTRALFLNS